MKPSLFFLALSCTTLACASSEPAPPGPPEHTAHGSAATIDDLRADNVFGQPDLVTGTEPTVVSINTARRPAGLSVGSTAFGLTLTIADRGNHRVRSLLASSLTPTATAFHLGQSTWDVGEANGGFGPAYSTLSGPTAVAQSTSDGRYSVADTDNHRVLIGYFFSTPSYVIGQHGSFTSGLRNNGGITSQSLAEPRGVAWSSTFGMRLFIADSGNHRLLVFTDTTFNFATWVLGQHDPISGSDVFTRGEPNDGKDAPSAMSFRDPRGLAISAFDFSATSGSVWVADTGNHRVLHFPECSGFEGSGRPCPTADFVLGQKDFVTADPSAGGVNEFSLNAPTAVAVDRQGGVWVADTGHHRVLHFKRGSTKADRVLGQPDFTTATAPTTVSASTLFAPTGIAVDTNGDLYVADTGSNRVLRYHFIASLAACDDNDPCTDDSVDSSGRCVNASRTDSKACFPYRCDTFRHACLDTCTTTGGTNTCQGSGTYACTSSGRCVRKCFSRDEECPGGGHCVDGYCCDSSCSGTCEACNVPFYEGTCHEVTGPPVNVGGITPRRTCARAGLDDPECGGACDGRHRSACIPAGENVTCGPETCNDGVATLRGTCDGRGRCTFVTQACAPYACAPNGCRTDCTAAHHCAAGADCIAGQCVSANDQKVGNAGCAIPGGVGDEHVGAWALALGALTAVGVTRRRTTRHRDRRRGTR